MQANTVERATLQAQPRTYDQSVGASGDAPADLASPAGMFQNRLLDVLLVEHDQEEAGRLEEALSRARAVRFNVTRARTWQQAQELLTSRRPDALLAALSQPDSEALDALAEVRASAQLVPTVVLGDRDDEAAAMQAIQLGASDYLVRERTGTDLLTRSICYAVDCSRYREARATLDAELEQEVLARTAQQRGTIKELEGEIDRQAQTAAELRASGTQQQLAILDMQEEMAGHRQAYADQGALLANEQATRAQSDASRAEISAILEGITDAFFSVDADWRFTYINKEAERLMRKSREALLGRNMFEAYPEAEGAGFQAKFREAMDTRTAVEHEAYYSPFETWFAANAYPHESGGLSIYFRDVTARKRADAERERLASIVESSDDAILAKTLDGVITNWNQGAQRMYGYTQDEAVGKPVRMLVPPDRRKEVDAILDHICRGERVEPYETLRRTKWGEEIAVSISVSPILDEAGSIVGASVIARDITARKRAEEALEARERHFRSIVMSLQEGLLVQDADGHIIDCNEMAEQVLGLTKDQMMGLTSLDPRWQSIHDDGSPFPGEDHPAMVSLRTGEFLSNVIMGVRKPDGSLTWISINSHPLFNPAETRPYAVAVTFSDITEKRKAQEEVSIHAQVLDQVQAGVIVTNMELQVTHWNAHAEELYGWKREETLGRQISELLVMPPDLPLAKEVIEQIAREGYWEGEFPIQHKDGTQFPAYVIDSVIRDDKGAPIAIAGVSMDIRDRKAREQQLQRQFDHLGALRTIDLVITASLDLRVTLSIILEQVTSELGVDAACVLLLNKHTQTLEYAAGRGFRYSEAQNTRLRLGQGFAGRAALTRSAIHIPDILNGGEPPILRVAEKEEFVMYHALPLIAKGQVQGVIEVLHRAPLEPDAEWFNFAEALAGQTAIAIDNAMLFDDLQRSNTELALAYDNTLEGWSRALDLRDKETEGHTQRVSDMTLRLARAMGVGEADLLHVQRGALLHDMGKMGIPDSILLKPGPLTEEEWEIMRRHPVYAYELLSPITFLRPALDIPYCHHEKWDGTGYPRGLKGEQIPLSARIFAVVDVYDALRSDRPYRPAWSRDKVREYIRQEAGTHFDPKVVEVFLSMDDRR